jgi:hypothetical protein
LWLALWLSILGLGLCVPVSPAFANGNYSHVWAAMDALNYLEDGELGDLLKRPDLLLMIQNGAMYPDSGYAVNDAYGEITHWEPFQTVYLDWIRDTFQPPWTTDEAAQHIAFLMGMAAHGMSDQLYDGMFLERAEFRDGYGDVSYMGGIDGVTDTCFAAAMGPMDPPQQWVPAEVLAPLYHVSDGHTLAPTTIELGQSLVVVAVMFANDRSQDEKNMAELRSLYPWACGNQDNPFVPGSPVTHAPAIANYWQVLWQRLHGSMAFDQPLLGTYYTSMEPWEQVQDASSPESWVAFVMPRGLNPSTVNSDTVKVTDTNLVEHPVRLNVYYGWNSHLVNIRPEEDWTEDTAYSVSIKPPVTSWNGIGLETTHTFRFATSRRPPILEDLVDEDIRGDTETDTGDSGSHGPAPHGGCSLAAGLDASSPPSPFPFCLLSALTILVLMTRPLLPRRRTE